MGVEPAEKEPQVGSAIARITAWLARQAELALSESDLSLPQYRILSLLADGMALPSSIAESLDVRRPSVTAVVDGLVARGLVVREHDKNDRRKVTHSITPEGRCLVEAADTAVAERLGSIAHALGDEQVAAEALEGLTRWGAALVEWRKQKTREQVPS